MTLLAKIKFFLIKTIYLFAPVADFLFNLVYLTRLSRWIRLHPLPKEFVEHMAGKIDIVRRDLYEYIVVKEGLKNESIDYLEFGVYKGASLRWWS